MVKHNGPVDDTIRKLLEFVAARRASPMRNWRGDERREFKNLVGALHTFAFKVGYFATPHVQAIDAAYDGVIADLRARVGKLSWLISLSLMMKVISRNCSMSGWVFQELRERIKTITTDGPPLADSPMAEQEVIRRLDEVAPAFVSLRHDHASCELAKHKRNPRLEKQGYCGRGCDVLMLMYLRFHPILIGRVLGGLKDGTTRSRVEDCRNNLRSVRQRLDVLAR